MSKSGLRAAELVLLSTVFVSAGALSAAPCAPSPSALCLNGSRFQAQVSWRDSHGRTGVGTAVPLTSDTGYFWFFGASNVELIVKVLDARSLNGKFWVFFGALSSVQYDLTVTDTSNGSTKTYHNPLGQFASVGDTSAFAGEVGAPAVTDSVVTEGTPAAPESLEAMPVSKASTKAAADFTPCLTESTRLGLASCRFLLHVSWRDAHGRSGEGQAVQLTNDTGYFWFFGPNNVELMVKVLDARPINGNFWVFYGALSNVEYDLVVTDKLTGVVKSYRNDAGTLASVGDTAAFVGGTSVVAIKDDSRASSATVDASGGTLTATAADGSTFTLEIPEDALVFPTLITMTPLSQIDQLPFSRGLRGGVQLEPEGLFLFEPALLTIRPASPPLLEELVTFAYRGGGDDLILFAPVSRTPDPRAIQLSISHFSGAGAAGATNEEVVRAAHTPSRYFEPYIQASFNLIFDLWHQRITEEVLQSQMTALWQQAWDSVVWPATEALGNRCEPASFEPVIRMGFEYLNLVGTWVDQRMLFSKREIFLATIKSVMLQCIDAAYNRCKNEYDPFEVSIILGILRQLQKAQLIDDNEYGGIYAKIDGCLRFEVSFDTTMTVASTEGADTVIEQFELKATIPVSLEQTGQHFVLTGHAPLRYQSLQGTIATPCTLTYINPTTGNFRIERLGIDGLFVKLDHLVGGRFSFAAEMFYEPGDPKRQSKIACGPGSATSPPLSVFKPTYLNGHLNESIAGTDDPEYFFTEWEPVLAGPILARKYYSPSGHYGDADVDETTTIILKHTPQ